MDPISIAAAVAAAVAAGSGSALASGAWAALRKGVARLLAPAESLPEPGTLVAVVASPPQTLEDRLKLLTDLMGQSALLSEQVSAELEARAATARKLQEEAETAEALAALHREQAEAVRRMIDAELASNSAAIRKDVRKDAIKIGIGSFFAGGGVTLLITLLVHPLH